MRKSLFWDLEFPLSLILIFEFNLTASKSIKFAIRIKKPIIWGGGEVAQTSYYFVV